MPRARESDPRRTDVGIDRSVIPDAIAEARWRQPGLAQIPADLRPSPYIELHARTAQEQCTVIDHTCVYSLPACRLVAAQAKHAVTCQNRVDMVARTCRCEGSSYVKLIAIERQDRFLARTTAKSS